jgi:hypothetical protein
MPYAGEDFPDIDVSEAITLAFDFVDLLGFGEVVTSATWTAAVANWSKVFDPSAYTIVSSQAQIYGGHLVGQQFSGMLNGVTYLVTATAITNYGNKLIAYSHFYTEIPK